MVLRAPQSVTACPSAPDWHHGLYGVVATPEALDRYWRQGQTGSPPPVSAQSACWPSPYSPATPISPRSASSPPVSFRPTPVSTSSSATPGSQAARGDAPPTGSKHTSARTTSGTSRSPVGCWPPCCP